MRLTTYAVVYILGIALLGSALAWMLAQFIDYEYVKILSRVLLLLVAASLMPLWRLNGMNRKSIGFTDFQARRFLLYLAVSIITLTPLMLLFVASAFRIWDPMVVVFSAEFGRTLLVIAFGSILVAIFEEALFRGFLQRLVGRRMGASRSIVVVSIFYGLMHFLRPSGETIVDPGLLTGFIEILGALAGVGSAFSEVTSFLSLIGIGLILGFTREKYGLWVPIALHTGWVFGIRTFKELTVRDVISPYAEWTGSYDNFIGPLSLFWLVFIFVLVRLAQGYQTNLRLGVSK